MTALLFSSNQPFKPNAVKRRDWLWLLLILVTASVVRLSNPQVMDYRQDQADLVTLVQDMLDGKSFPLVGIPSSSRFPNSPVTVYTLIPPYLISDSPVVAAMYVALLNVLSIGLLWLLAYRYFNVRVAIFAGLAYALNPWAVGFSRSIWAQDYVAPFLVLGLLMGLYGFLEGKRIGQILCLPLLLWGAQIHIAVWAVMPVYLWLFWIGRKRLTKSALVFTVLLSALVMLPFGLGILKTLSEPSVVSGVAPLRREMSFSGLVKPYGQMAWLITGLGTEQYGARAVADQLVNSIFGPVPLLLWLLCGAATILGAFGVLRRFRLDLAIFALIWAFMQLLVNTIPILDVFPFYLIASFPGLMILTGVGVDWALDLLRERQVLQRAVVAVFALIFVTQAYWSLGSNRFVDQTNTPTQFGFGTPIHFLFDIRDKLESYKDVVVVGTGEWVDVTASGSRVWASLLRETVSCVRDVTLNANFAVIPQQPFAVLYTPNTPSNVLVDSLYRNTSSTVVALRPGEGEYTINEFQQATPWTETSFTDVSGQFENGATLTGYNLQDNKFSLRWTLPAASETNYRYSLTALDASGNVIGQPYEADFWPSLNWCAGDELISWVDAPMPETLATVRVEMKPSNSHDPLNVRDEAGNVVGTSVEFPVSLNEASPTS